MHLDPTGQVLCVGQGGRNECDLFRLPAGTPIGSMTQPTALGPAADLWLTSETRSGEKQPSTLVFRRETALPILSLGTEAMTTTASAFQFSPDGRSVAWANSDGTVDIADLAELSSPTKAFEQRK